MLGYATKKYNSQHGQYGHLEIQVYFDDGYGFRQLAKVTWQADKTNSGWYAFRIEMSNTCDSSRMFEQYVNFVSKIKKDDMFATSPAQFVEWFKNMRGMKRIVYDNRLRQHVTVEDYVKTETLDGYKVYVNNDYILDVLAYSEDHAESLAAKKVATGSVYNWKTYLRNWNTVRFEKMVVAWEKVDDLTEFVEPTF